MRAFSVIRALGPIDLKSVLRDPLLKWMIFLPLLIAPIMRWVLPPLLERFEELFQVAISIYYAPFASYMLLMLVPLLSGMITGFLLLDQRDDGTLSALLVSPLSLPGYVLYRLGLPMTVSVLVTLVVFPLAGFEPIGFWPLLLVALVAALEGPIFALLVGTLAQNKVQGFAVAKASGIILVPPLIAWFVPLPMQLAFGLAPTYWPAKCYWAFMEGGTAAWGYVLAGLAWQLLWIGGLLRRYERIVRSG